ncbi:hypothetical protein HK097_006891, partial [Rhizophlyctis rosea]
MFMEDLTIRGKILALVSQGLGGLLAVAASESLKHASKIYAMHDTAIRLLFKSVKLTDLTNTRSAFTAATELKLVRVMCWIIPLATLLHEVATEIVPEDMSVNEGVCTHFEYGQPKDTSGHVVTGVNFLERYEGFRDKVLYERSPLVFAPVSSTLIDADHTMKDVKSTDKQDAFYIET